MSSNNVYELPTVGGPKQAQSKRELLALFHAAPKHDEQLIANLALFGSLRAIHEPYNWTRKVIGFDTFEGYPETDEKDGDSPHATAGGYAMPENYDEYLSRVLDVHEQDNVMDHVCKYELVKGDASESLKAYLAENPETVIALAYLDMAMYESTRDVLELLLPHMVKGSVIALDELGSSKFPGETLAFKEIVGTGSFQMTRSQFLPDRTIVTVE